MTGVHDSRVLRRVSTVETRRFLFVMPPGGMT